MTEVEFRDKYKNLINSQHDIYFYSNEAVDYSEIIGRIIACHDNIKEAVYKCLDIERLYPRNSEHLKSLVNDLIIDYITNDSSKSDLELYFFLYTNIQRSKNMDDTKRKFVNIINENCSFDREAFLKEIQNIDKAKEDFHIKTNRRKVVAIDSNGYRIFTEEIKSLNKYLKKYDFIVNEKLQGINDSPFISTNGSDFNALSIAIVIIVGITILVLLLSLGFFGILFLIGVPGLVLSICKKAGR